MKISLEPKKIREWLEPLGLDLEGLLDQSASRQAEIIRFWLPAEELPPSPEERTALAVLGWAVGDRALQEQAGRSLMLALLELFLAIDEMEVAGQLFGVAYPEPEPNRVTYFSHLIRLRLAQGDQEGAALALTEMQELYANRFTTFTAQASFCLVQGDRVGARAAYRQALQDSPNSSTLLLGLARCAVLEGDREEAENWLARLEELPQLSWNTLRQMASLWWGLGEEERATEKEAACATQRALKLVELAGTTSAVTARPETNLEVIPDLPELPAHEKLGDEPFRVLKEIFGHDQFRPGQEQVIANVLAGRDTLAVLPTGAGKSLCYQLPALLLPRPVLVLSPLISLMKDQFDKLPPLLKQHSLIINSSLEPGEAARRLRDLSRPGNTIRLIYAAPERLRQQPFVLALKRAQLGLLVVDEAHCVAMWGNDFRPDYLFIKRALADLAEFAPTLLAVTATATPEVAEEIGQQLGRGMELVRGSVYRPNLRFGVEKLNTGSDYRLQRVAELCAGLEGSGIIYARSREKCEQVAEFLNRNGIAARFYHAGMDSETRRTTQENWSAGRTQVIVATIAFGMGIDKANVRYIIHLSPPAALENYVQEAGRAGRDGQPAQCLLLYTSSDKGNLTRFLHEEQALLNLDLLRSLYGSVSRHLRGTRQGVILAEDLPRGATNPAALLDETVVRVGLSLLERAGLLERGYDLPPAAEVTLKHSQPTLFSLDTAPSIGLAEFIEAAELRPGQPITIQLASLAATLGWEPPVLEARLLEWAEAGRLEYTPARRGYYLSLKEAGSDARARLEEILGRKQTAADYRLDQLEDYLKHRACRQVALARHFGERLARPCGNCDNCTDAPSRNRSSRTRSKVEAFSKPGSVASSSANGREINGPAVIADILTALQKTDRSLSRTALRRILLGSDSAYPSEQSNPRWGVLQGLVRHKELDAQTDELVKQGLISLDESVYDGRTYSTLLLSEAGLEWLDNYGAGLIEPEEAPATSVKSAVARSVSKPAAIEEDEAARLTLACLDLVTGGGEARVGRSGLVRVLQGQPSALSTRANNPYKGSLEGKLKLKETEKLVERLIERGLIEEETVTGSYGREYQALKVSQTGQEWIGEGMKDEG